MVFLWRVGFFVHPPFLCLVAICPPPVGGAVLPADGGRRLGLGTI